MSVIVNCWLHLHDQFILPAIIKIKIQRLSPSYHVILWRRVTVQRLNCMRTEADELLTVWKQLELLYWYLYRDLGNNKKKSFSWREYEISFPRGQQYFRGEMLSHILFTKIKYLCCYIDSLPIIIVKTQIKILARDENPLHLFYW